MSNQAAWIKEAKAYPFQVGPAPRRTPGPGEVVVKTKAIALHASKANMQLTLRRQLDFFNQKYPFILGADIAGTVEEVGEGVTHVKNGQRVLGCVLVLHIISTCPVIALFWVILISLSYCMGLGVNDPAFGAYQLYPTLHASLVAPIPDDVDFVRASVLPLAITTVAVNLYHPDHLGLPLPSLTPKPTGKTLLVWGGSSSVGATAIQMAIASGLEVVTTASKRNHELVKSLGATAVFDYNSPTVVEDLLADLSGRNVVAISDAISEPESTKLIDAILATLGPRTVGMVVWPAVELSENFKPSMSLAFEILNDKGKEILEAVWKDWVPKALVTGQLQFKPDSVVVGEGLESLQSSLDKLKAGVSAQKLVVKIES
ncbi:Zinc-binding alcohol dehydrogenase domain-containing protein cipB 4 [Colletotrichum chlorophyti]|uniref:Zinc-binding alcohol dehydrogenase domain-containing protein cipB 4 n=1 Tax=Colletotrichum chlorophyti TaxID=708187 RepID=A0A1Q8RAR7_9PEZI|nr:Zinc-binding alcohol dehydrogenase domain-containing protein cipB 4 [Colletotrichum chlorophyti]